MNFLRLLSVIIFHLLSFQVVHGFLDLMTNRVLNANTLETSAGERENVPRLVREALQINQEHPLPSYNQVYPRSLKSRLKSKLKKIFLPTVSPSLENSQATVNQEIRQEDEVTLQVIQVIPSRVEQAPSLFEEISRNNQISSIDEQAPPPDYEEISLNYQISSPDEKFAPPYEEISRNPQIASPDEQAPPSADEVAYSASQLLGSDFFGIDSQSILNPIENEERELIEFSE